MDVKDAARYLKLNHMTVYRMAQRGRLPAFKVGGAWRFKRDVLEGWLSRQSRGGPKLALVVDDDPMVLELMQHMVSMHGYQVTAAASGAAAPLAAIEQGSYDVVLLDLILPDIRGTEVLHRLKEMKSNAVVAIVTGHADAGVAFEAVEMGPTLLIRKPFSGSDIASVLKMAGKQMVV